MQRTVYRIFNKKKNTYLGAYNYFGTESKAKQLTSLDNARKALSEVVKSEIYGASYRRWRYNQLPTDFDLSEIENSFEILETTITYAVAKRSNTNDMVRNTVLGLKIRDQSTRFHIFWENAVQKGYADEINYIMRLDIKQGQTTAQAIKEARDGIRQLGIKTRTFREFNGMFGFYNKDQALKAKLTIDFSGFIDIGKVKEELFG